MLALIHLFCGSACLIMGVKEFCLLEHTRHWPLFWNTFFAGFNFYFMVLELFANGWI